MALVPSYAFGTDSTVDSIFLEAFERIQVPGSMLDVIKTDSAFRSVNSLLVEWLGKYEVDFTRKRKTFNLVPNQSTYVLSLNTFNVIDVLTTTVLSATRGNGSSEGNVADGSADDFNAAFSCKNLDDVNVFLSAADDWIGWQFKVPSLVSYICIIPDTNTPGKASLSVEYSMNGTNWISVHKTPFTLYDTQPLTWIYVEQPVIANFYRVSLSNGSLSIAGIYFGVGTYQKIDTTTVNSYIGSADRVLGAISFSDWMNTSSKNTLGTTSSYVFDAGIPPKMILYPVPGLTTPQFTDDNSIATNVMYSCNCFPADVADLVQTFDVPKAFIEALISGLTFRLAQKFKPELMGVTQQMAEASMANAFKSNYSMYPLTLEPKRGFA